MQSVQKVKQMFIYVMIQAKEIKRKDNLNQMKIESTSVSPQVDRWMKRSNQIALQS
jgi:hypothetical protein